MKDKLHPIECKILYLTKYFKRRPKVNYSMASLFDVNFTCYQPILPGVSSQGICSKNLKGTAT